MSERPQSQKHFEQAKLILDTDVAEGKVADAFDGNTPDGIFQILVEYGTTPVKLQQRLPEPNKAVGSWEGEGDWKTVQVIPIDPELEAYSGTIPLCSNFEYQFTTDTAGARVTLGAQWEGVN